MLLPLLWLPLALLVGRRWFDRGARPPTLLVLRVFRRDAEVQQLFDTVIDRWRLTGNTVLIAGTDLADRTLDADDIFAFIDGRLAERFIRDPAEVDARIAAFDLERDADGRYRINECYCHDTTWQAALDALVRRSDVVLMDLRGFQAHNAGCLHELAVLSRQSGLQRVVVLADAVTDRAAAAERGGGRGAGSLRLARCEPDRRAPRRRGAASALRAASGRRAVERATGRRAMSEAAPFVDPRRVVLFSGHRVDPAGRVPPRFPDDKAEHAGALIDRALRDLDVGPGDLALTQGSSGGDLLFAEAAARRGARLRLMQPAPEPRFIEESVRASANGDAWVRRYLALRAQLPEPPLRAARGAGRDRGPIGSSAATTGCSTPRSAGGRSGCASSACGTAARARGPAAPRRWSRRCDASACRSHGWTCAICEDTLGAAATGRAIGRACASSASPVEDIEEETRS